MSQPSNATPSVLTIRCREHGPLVITLDPNTPFQLTDHLGQAYVLPTHKPSVALCRCGASQNKPFCDGAHKNCNFQAGETAPAPTVSHTPLQEPQPPGAP